MKNIKKNSLINSFIFSKICVGSSMAYTDPTNFNVLLGYRKSLFALINPFSFQYSLKTCFIFLESFVKNKYDFIFTMLATESTHGHHKGAAVLMMQVVSELSKDKRPIVLSGTMFSHQAGKPSEYKGFPGYPLTKVSSDTAFVTFDRMQKFGYNDRLNYQIIGNWVIAEHKSQGSMQLLMNRGEIECYWFLDMNQPKDFQKVYALFSSISPQYGK